jgi:hypothetical protein
VTGGACSAETDPLEARNQQIEEDIGDGVMQVVSIK